MTSDGHKLQQTATNVANFTRERSPFENPPRPSRPYRLRTTALLALMGDLPVGVNVPSAISLSCLAA
jgi:hypothetical protein